MDDKHEKQMMRNQTIAFILMAVVLVGYFLFFQPTPRKQPVQPPPAVTQQQQLPSEEAAEAPSPVEPAPPAWSELPSVPEITNPEAYEVGLADGQLDLTFTRVGARLKRAFVLPQNGGASQQVVPESSKPDTDAVYPLGLTFTEEGLRDQLNYRLWEVAEQTEHSVLFELTIPGRAVVDKRFTLDPGRHMLSVDVDWRNLTGHEQALGLDQTPAYYLTWGPDVSSGDTGTRSRQSIIWRKGEVNEQVVTSKMAKDGEPYYMATPGVDWIGVKSRYFVVALKPDFADGVALAEGEPKDFRVAVGVPRFDVPPGGTQKDAFSVYVGPSEQESLSHAWPSLATAQQFFTATWWWMDWFAKFLLTILNWFYAHVIANYGVAIIFLTIVVRLAMFPLTLKSMKSMKKMQLLGPELEKLKEKYGEEQQELNKKMMEMYRERGVNPLGGCFPMLLQMPVFIALYRMLWNAYELRGAHFFLWITDLSQPDHLVQLPWLHAVPLLGMFEWVNVLPILMGVSMVVSQKVTPTAGPSTNPQQKLMMTIMPVFFSFICYNMAAGLNLYILTSTLLGMLQQKFVRVGEIELKQKKKTPAAKKKQHFYTAAMARKRQMEKEAKKSKRKHR